MYNYSRFPLGLLLLAFTVKLLGCNGNLANDRTQFADNCYQIKEAINQSYSTSILVTKAAISDNISHKERLVRKLEILTAGDRQLHELKSQLIAAYREEVHWSRLQMNLMNSNGTITIFEQDKAQLEQIQSNQTKANKLAQTRYEQLRDYCALK